MKKWRNTINPVYNPPIKNMNSMKCANSEIVKQYFSYVTYLANMMRVHEKDIIRPIWIQVRNTIKSLSTENRVFYIRKTLKNIFKLVSKHIDNFNKEEEIKEVEVEEIFAEEDMAISTKGENNFNSPDQGKCGNNFGLQIKEKE